MQAWPSRYDWTHVVSLSKGEPTGRPIYAVRFSRKLPESRAARGLAALLDQLRLKGPIDITFHARVVIDIGTGKEKAVPIPVEKAWRPGVSGGVLIFLLTRQCELPSCAHFPLTSSESTGKGSCHSTTCLRWRTHVSDCMPNCYRRYMGTRFVKYNSYVIGDIKAGSHRKGRFVPAPDGIPPLVQDLPPLSPSRIFRLGGIRIDISRARPGE